MRSVGLVPRLILLAVVLVVLAACGGGNNFVSSITTATLANVTTTVAATQHPLVAEYSVSAPYAGQAMVEFGTDKRYGRQTAWFALPGDGSPLAMQVAGMKASTTYHMRATVYADGMLWTDRDQTFTTGPLPAITFPTLTVTRPTSALASTENPGIEMINLLDWTGQTHVMQSLFSDRDGNPIWYYNVGVAQGYFPFPIKPLPNGHILLSIANNLSGSLILREVDLAGNTIREITLEQLNQKLQQIGFSPLPVGIHHDVLPLKSGHMILLVTLAKNFTDLPGYPGTTEVIGDGLVEVDEDGNPVWEWSSFDHLDVNRHPGALPDWTHSNAIVYLPADGDLLLSMRNQAWVLKIDYRDGTGTGNVLWRLGHEGDFALAGGHPSDWFYFQHYPSLISQDEQGMTLAIFDNGNNRVLDDDGTMCGTSGNPGCQTRATKFHVDESAHVATLLWEDSPGFFTFWGGSINELGNGNMEFALSAPAPVPPGAMSVVQEVSPAPVPQVVWEMDIGGANAYRAYRVPSLYPGVTWRK